MPDEKFDAIVIGTGQGGGPLATALARAGWHTAIIERGYVGGTCINVGCTPSKTMVASAEVAHQAGQAEAYGVHAGPVSVDMAAVVRRKNGVVESFRAGTLSRFEDKDHLELIRGEARFVGNKVLEIALEAGGSRRLTAATIVIDTGGRPARPDLPGLNDVSALDSTSVMDLSVVPEHLLVLGGGYVALEFGQMFRRFGSQVTVIQRGDHLLSREDDDVADAMAGILAEDGIRVLLNAQAREVRRSSDGQIEMDVQTPDGAETLTGSHLLVATGRQPNTEALNLPATGLAADKRGALPVNERLETTVAGVYAIGDVNGGPAFTHISYDDYRVLRANLLEGQHCTTTGRQIPYVVFTDPQLGRVGLSEREAAAQGRRVRVARLPMTSVARAIEVGDTRGFLKALVDADTQEILGCAFLGIDAGELLAMIQIAMLGHVPYTTLADGIFSHPTLAESLNNLFAALS